MGQSVIPSSILDALEIIVEKAEASKLSNDFFQENQVIISYASKRLKLSEKQVVFLALFVDKHDEKSVSLSQLAQFVGCRPMHLLNMTEDIEILEKLRYIRSNNGGKSTLYRVPKEVIKALTHNEPYVYQPPKAIDLVTFFDGFKKLFKEKESNEIDYNSLLSQTMELLNRVSESSLSRGLKKYKLDKEDSLLFIYMAYLLVEDCNEDIRFYEIENLYDNDEIPPCVKSQLRNRTSDLFDKKLIENTMEEGMGRSDAFKVTEKAKFELLSDLNLKEFGQSEKGLIKCDSFPKKKLFYNPGLSAKVKELSNILISRNFRQLQLQLKEAGLRTGFCCLFYGAPGTGKTETAYQIARLTKRNIMQVDVDKIKSCWVGESEKNIKTLFDRYRVLCKNSSHLPILLFNEADAVLGLRMEGASKAVDKMENSIQNIILQEMENLEGIMIATTNLTTNLDKAFERRFLYKLNFEKPSVESRVKIWESMMPALNRKEILCLAAKYNLSGGEIENVVRRHKVRSILCKDKKTSLADLEESCKLEHLSDLKRIKIGF